MKLQLLFTSLNRTVPNKKKKGKHDLILYNLMLLDDSFKTMEDLKGAYLMKMGL